MKLDEAWGVMFQYSFLSLFARPMRANLTTVRTYTHSVNEQKSLMNLAAPATDSTTAAPEGGSILNNNVSSLFSGGSDSVNSGGNTVQIIIWYFVIVIAVVAALFFVRKFLLTRVKGFGGGKRMRVSDRIVISQDKQIMMVELSGKMMIVGVAGHTINQLALLDKNECAELPEDESNSFGNILSDKIGAIKRQSGDVKNNLPDVKKNDE